MRSGDPARHGTASTTCSRGIIARCAARSQRGRRSTAATSTPACGSDS